MVNDMEIKYEKQVWRFKDVLDVGDFVDIGIPPAELFGLKNQKAEMNLAEQLAAFKPILNYLLGLLNATKLDATLNVRQIPTAALLNFVLKDQTKLMDWIMKGLIGLNE